MNKRLNKTLNAILYPIILILIIFLIWYFASIAVNSEFILPTPTQTLNDFFLLLSTKTFWLSFSHTLLRTFISFIFSFLLASVLAMLSFQFKIFSKILSPLVSILRATPTIAVILLFLIWTTSNIAPILISMLVILPILYTSIYSSLNNINKDILEMCKVYKVRKKDIIFKVCIPQVWASTYLSVSSSLSLNLKLMVAAEVLANTTNSLGGLMQGAKIYFEMSNLMAITLITIIIALLLEFLINLANRPIRRWQ